MIFVITGQTATGKTKLALEYAKKYNGELVNFDSRQVYKYLNIITGKDLPASKIWLYDIITPDVYFSSYEYIKYAQNILKDINKNGKTPILVGGSYFYLKHLLYGFDFQVPPNFTLRKKLNDLSVAKLQKMLDMLNSNNKKIMNNSDWNNPRRLIRKIEIETYGSNFKRQISGIMTDSIKIVGLSYKNKDNLRNAITIRVNKRLKQGAIDEVKSLLKMGYKKTDPGLKTIGYKQIIELLEGKISKIEAIEKWITAEVQYAKRQYTFMKKDKNIKWTNI